MSIDTIAALSASEMMRPAERPRDDATIRDHRAALAASLFFFFSFYDESIKFI